MVKKRFKTELATESGKELFIKIPFDVKATFGKARPPVKVTVNGYVYKSTVAVYGGSYYLPVRKSHRDAAHVKLGQTVDVTLEIDDEPRIVDVPPELEQELKKNKKARLAWEKLSFSCKREHVEAILEAKRPETKARRIQQALDSLKA
jgi:hypothetical protein